MSFSLFQKCPFVAREKEALHLIISPPPLEQLVNATSANQWRLNETNGLHLKTHTFPTSQILPTDVWHLDESRRLILWLNTTD